MNTSENKISVISQHGDNAVATAPIRLMAVLYDGMLVLALLFLVALVLVVIGTMAFGMAGTQSADARQLPDWYRHAVLSPSFVLSLYWFYGIFWRKSGQTLGMQTWRLKTISSDGKLLSWGQGFIRILCACIVPMVCTMVGYMLYRSYNGAAFSGIFGFLLNYLFCYVHPKGLAVHDLLSNSVTIRVPKIEHTGLFASFGKRRS